MPVVAQRPDGKYVMQFWSGHCGFVQPCTEVAFADSPFGPFANITRIPLRGTPSSQMGFFADADGQAYVKYNTVGPDQHHAIAAGVRQRRSVVHHGSDVVTYRERTFPTARCARIAILIPLLRFL